MSVKHLDPPQQMRSAMAQQAIAERENRVKATNTEGKVLVAEGKVLVANQLVSAAEQMEKSPSSRSFATRVLFGSGAVAVVHAAPSAIARSPGRSR